MSADNDMVMLSALQHYLFCPRQCALIHVEGLWSENYLTSAGRRLHERVDSGRKETRRDVHVATSLRLVSNRLNMTGVADLVEFHRVEDELDETGGQRAVRLPGREGWWRPFPVEYKHGKPKEHRADEVQLCAQAICLEEMFSLKITSGALFYGGIRRRVDVSFDDDLRQLVEMTARRVSELMVIGETPSPVRMKGCEACSLKEHCLEGERSARKWIEDQVAKTVKGAPGHE